MSYETDSLNLFSVRLGLNNEKSIKQSDEAYSISDTEYSAYRLKNYNDSKNMGGEASFNYQHGFKKDKNRLLTGSYQYREHGNLLHNDIRFSNKVNYGTDNYKQRNVESFGEHAFQIDYVQPMGAIVAEGGVKAVFRTNESEFLSSRVNAQTGTYDTDPLLSDEFDSRQQIIMAYNSYTYQIRSWQLKAGIRAEETSTDIFSIGSTKALNQKYVNVLPVILVNKKLAGNSTFNFSVHAKNTEAVY